MTDIELPYPSAPFAAGEVAHEIDGDTVTCVCGNDDSFSAADHTGRLAFIKLGEVPPFLGELPDSPALAVCNNCGRVYDDANLSGSESPVIARIDTENAEWEHARALYGRENFGV